MRLTLRIYEVRLGNFLIMITALLATDYRAMDPRNLLALLVVIVCDCMQTYIMPMHAHAYVYAKDRSL